MELVGEGNDNKETEVLFSCWLHASGWITGEWGLCSRQGHRSFFFATSIPTLGTF